jgi:hypothetical protein
VDYVTFRCSFLGQLTNLVAFRLWHNNYVARTQRTEFKVSGMCTVQLCHPHTKDRMEIRCVCTWGCPFPFLADPRRHREPVLGKGHWRPKPAPAATSPQKLCQKVKIRLWGIATAESGLDAFNARFYQAFFAISTRKKRTVGRSRHIKADRCLAFLVVATV